MTIENTLERIANTLELIAQNLNPGNTPSRLREHVTLDQPATVGGTGPLDLDETVAELTPAQKGAATKKANRAIAAAAALAATPAGAVQGSGAVVATQPAAVTPPGTGTVAPGMVDTLHALNSAQVPEGEAPALVMPAVPADLPNMLAYAKTVAAYLGPDLNKIAELLAGTYQVSRLPDMNVVHYAQFTQDLHNLALAKHQAGTV